MKRVLLSSVLAGVLLVLGCGSDSDSSGDVTKVANVSGSVVDGPIVNAQVCLDMNFNEICDASEPTAITDENGTYTLSNVDLSVRAPILVLPKEDTFDAYTHSIFTKKLSAPFEGSTTTNINPLTTIIGGYMYKLKDQISEEDIEEIKGALARALELNSSDLTQIDITKYPKAYANGVVLAQLLPSDLVNIDEAIDFTTLESGDLVSAIKDDNFKATLQSLMEAQLSSDDPILIQQAVEYSVENNVSFDPTQINAFGMESFLKDNRIFLSDGTELVIDGENFVDYSNGSIKRGTWEVEDDKLVFNYDDGSKKYILSITPIDVFSVEVEFDDAKVTYFTLPRDKTLDKLPGVTLFASINSGTEIKGDGIDLSFNSDNTFSGSLNGENISGNWEIDGGVLKISWDDADGNSHSGEFVLYDDKILGVYSDIVGGEKVDRIVFVKVDISTQTPSLVVPMSQDEIQAGLDLTNKYRAEVGVDPLVWNDDLAKDSEDWAAYLAQLGYLQHSSGSYGENLYYYATSGDQVATLSDAVNAWAAEKEFYLGGVVGADDYCEEGKVCGHYTQLVWSTTTEVGCGKAVIQDGDWKKTYIVCRYLPAGNIVGGKPY